jgi:hypothetical protein
MRIRCLLALPLLAGVLAMPAPARAQVNIKLQFGARLGPEVGVFAYAPERWGDWHTSYRKWTPVTLYDVNGHYYRTSVAGARPVLVYSYQGQYFFPPQDHAWIGFDKRYNYQHQPTPTDYGRVRPYEAPVRVDPRLGAEIGVDAYAADRAGDWHTAWRRWTPVTVYEVNGHYYPNSVAGARAVQIYRYQNEYFMPPHDQAWVGFDKRFNYQRKPTEADYGRVRPRP